MSIQVSAHWYVVNVYSGFEKKVAEIIKEQAKQKGCEDMFEEILIPAQQVIEIKKGEKVTKEQQFYPGYVLVKMILDDSTWHLVKDIPKVTGFLGSGGKPIPVSKKEVESILQQVEEGVSKPKNIITFEIGEKVRICEGPFKSFNGLVEQIDEEKGRLKVSVSVFGRSTPVEIEFTQVEKS